MTAPQIEELPISKLIVDPQVQRSVDRGRVNTILAEFRADAIGVITVSHRDDGTYHIIDGQHRIAAINAAGVEGHATVVANVYSGLSLADEAAMFRLLNNTRQVQPVDKFRVRVVEGEETAVAMHTILRRHGWRVEANKHQGAFAAVAAFEKVFKGIPGGAVDTEAVCDELIAALTQAWGHDADGARAEIVAGIGSVLLRYPGQVDTAKMIKELSLLENGPRGLVGRAKGLRSYQGGRLSDAVAQVVVGMVNKGRRTNRLPDWHSVV